MNKTVSRYDFEVEVCGEHASDCRLSQNLHPRGDFVEYCDYEALLDELEELQTKIKEAIEVLE